MAYGSELLVTQTTEKADDFLQKKNGAFCSVLLVGRGKASYQNDISLLPDSNA